MKPIAMLLLLLALLPACGLAVKEGIVEAAPDVTVELEEMTTALFGAWEQGLSDIRTAAVQAAKAWKPGIGDLSLERIALFNSPMDGEADNDELSIYFRYLSEERRNARLTVRYVRGTGAMTWISDTLLDGGEEHAGAALTEPELENIARTQLTRYALAQDAALLEADDGENAYRWIARFVSQAGTYEVCLDRQTGEVIRVSLYVKEEMP